MCEVCSAIKYLRAPPTRLLALKPAKRLVVAFGLVLPSLALAASADDLLDKSGPLSPKEASTVLAGVRTALDGTTVRVSQDGSTIAEVLMGPDGRPKIVMTNAGWDVTSSAALEEGNQRIEWPERTVHTDVTTIIEYTGRRARSCHGTEVDGELVIEYVLRSSDAHWTVSARLRTQLELLSPVFDMIAGALPVESHELRRSGDHNIRVLVAPWRLPAGTEPGSPPAPGITQSLWIDTESMLPVRWGVSAPATAREQTSAGGGYSISFIYDHSIRIAPPDHIARPDCV